MQKNDGLATPFTMIGAVIDKDISHRLMELRDRESITCWDLGRLVNDIYKRVTRRRMAVTKNDVCAYVAREIDSRDRSVSSIRQYAHMAEIWDRDFIEQHPVPFSHFQEAAKFGSDRATILDLSLQLMDSRGGAQVSADALGRYAEGLGYTRQPDEEDQPPDDPMDAPMQTVQPARPIERDPAFARLRVIARELSEISRQLQADYPFWAKIAQQLANLCDRITREMNEIEGLVIDN